MKPARSVEPSAILDVDGGGVASGHFEDFWSAKVVADHLQKQCPTQKERKDGLDLHAASWLTTALRCRQK